MNGQCEMHVLTSMIHISTVLDEMLNDLSVTLRTGRGQRRVPVVVFRRTSDPANGRYKICRLTSMVQISTMVDQMLNNFHVTLQTGPCQCRLPIFIFRCISEPALSLCVPATRGMDSPVWFRSAPYSTRCLTTSVWPF